MLGKILLIGIFAICLIGSQYVDSLKCYHCITNDPACAVVDEITCNQTNANRTDELIRPFHPNMSNATSDEYQCVWWNYTQIVNNITRRLEVRSCIYQEANACSFTPPKTRDFVGWVESCKVCGKDLCNRNSTTKVLAPGVLLFLLSYLGTFLLIKRNF